MDELRVEVVVKESVKQKLVINRLNWAGHVERMRDENSAKRADDALFLQGPAMSRQHGLLLVEIPNTRTAP